MNITQALRKVAGMQLSFGNRWMTWGGKRWIVGGPYSSCRQQVFIRTKSTKKAIDELVKK